MQILVVIRYGQRIALFPKVIPEKTYIRIGKHIREVGHTFTIGKVYGIAGNRFLHIIAYIHFREISSYTEPFGEVITGGDIKSFRQHFAVVYVSSSVFTTTQVGNVALDVIFGVPVDQPAIHIYRMFTESSVITQAEIQIIAVFGFYADISHFKVFITEHLFDGRQAISFLIRQFCLKSCQDEVGTCRAITHGTDTAGRSFIIALIGGGSHRTCHELIVILAEYGEIPFIGRHQTIGQAGNILAGLFGNGVFLFFFGKQ